MNEFICSIEHRIIAEICSAYAMGSISAEAMAQYVSGVNDMAAAINREEAAINE